MGCSTSKLDDEEAVQLCRDRKRFIKQAVEQRTRFASGHLAYIQSMKRVSAALKEYVEGDEPREFTLDSFITPPFTPVKKKSPSFISISPTSFLPARIQTNPNSTLKVNYLRSSGTPAISVEERPQSPQTVRVETYSPIHQFGIDDGLFAMPSQHNSTSNVNYLRPRGNPAISVEERPQSPEAVRVETHSPMHHFGIDGFFAMQSSPMNSSFFSYSPNNRPNIPSPSPQTSQWDFFWNPFSSLDYYGYPTRSSLEQTTWDDEIRGFREVREEEGIPDLEEDVTEQEDSESKVHLAEKGAKIEKNCTREEVLVEDADDEDEDDDDDGETDCECDAERELQGSQNQGRSSIEVSRSQTTGQVGVSNQEMAVGSQETKEETPGFTVYVNRRPTSMAEVIKDLDAQFKVVCNAANEVSALLEASRAQHSATSNELTAMKMLNPVALFRSASCRSSRFLMSSSNSGDEDYESSSDFSDESYVFSGGHQSTMDRLYAWEKKLYDAVRSGEKVRIAYDKKCKQLRNQDVKGDDSASVDKMRATIRDLQTQIKVSIHSIEAISKRIETLRDEELLPQLVELIQGLARMWKVMAESHQTQKRTLDEAKLLLAGTPSKLHAMRHSSMSVIEPHKLARSAANLETELRCWRACFESWISSQHSYVHALTGWLLRCMRCEADMSKLPFSPRWSCGTLPIFALCIKWSRFLDGIREMPVLDGLDFFATGMGSLYAQQRRDDSRRTPVGSKKFTTGFSDESGGNMEIVEVGQIEDVMTAEKMAELAIRVLCAGMSVAMSSLAEFAIASADGYTELVNQWENTKCSHSSVREMT